MSRPAPHLYCHVCGAAFDDTSAFPRACTECGNMVWLNPIPVSVLLVPVKSGDRTGLLVIRRGIEPQQDRLALVGGFLEAHETWQVGGTREVFEETGVQVDDASVEPFWFTSTDPRPNRVLLFGTVAEVDAATLPTFEPTSETTQRGAVFGPEGLDEVFAFPLHIEAAERWFAARGQSGPHEFTPL